MSFVAKITIDELRLDELITDSFTQLVLYSSTSPDGVFTTTSTVGDQTLAAANTAGAPHNFTFTYAAGNSALWYKIIAWDGASVFSDVNDSETFFGGGGTTRQRLRQLLGKHLKAMKIGTTTSSGAGGGSTALCTDVNFVRHPDDFFGGKANAGGWYFHDLTQGLWTEVSDWVQSTGTFTFSPALGAQVADSTEFELTSRFNPDEMNEAINWAINMAYPKLSKPVVDTSIVTVENTYLYDVPYNIRNIARVHIESLSNATSTSQAIRGNPWIELPYEIIYDGMTRQMEFKRELDDDRRIRIQGTAMLEQLGSDTSYVEVTEPHIWLLIYYAAHYLWAGLVNEHATTDVSRFKDQATYNMSLAQSFGDKLRTRRKPGRWWAEDSLWYS